VTSLEEITDRYQVYRPQYGPEECAQKVTLFIDKLLGEPYCSGKFSDIPIVDGVFLSVLNLFIAEEYILRRVDEQFQMQAISRDYM